MSDTTATELLTVALTLADGSQEEILELAQGMHPDRLAGLVLRLQWLTALIDPNTWCEGCRHPIRLTEGEIRINPDGRWHYGCYQAAKEART